MNFCSQCGSKIKEGQSFCSKCGSKQRIANDYVPQNNIPVQISNGQEKLSVKSSDKLFKYKVMISVILVLLIALAVSGIVFRDKLAGEYYIFRSMTTKDDIRKLDYACKALEANSSEYNIKVFNDICLDNISKQNDKVEEAVEQQKDILPQNLYMDLKLKSFQYQYKKYIDSNDNKNALAALINSKEFNPDFKSDKRYEELMIDQCLKVLGSTEKLTGKSDLSKKYMTSFGDYNDDHIDEIVVVRNTGKMDYDNSITAEIYCFNGGEYKLLTKQELDKDSLAIAAEYGQYDSGKVALFLSKSAGAHAGLVNLYVWDKNGFKRMMREDLYSLYPTGFADVDKDGIIEIGSMAIDPSSIEQSNAWSDKIISWFKVKGENNTVLAEKEFIKNNVKSEVGTGNQVATNNNTPVKNDSVTASVNSNTGYIFPNSDKEYLKDTDVAALSKDILALARNEIFARHGYVFLTQPFKDYFAAKNWYKPNAAFKGADEELNQYEIANYKLIKKYEEAK